MVNDGDNDGREVIGAVDDTETPIILNGHSHRASEGKPTELAKVPQNPVVKLQVADVPAIPAIPISVAKPAVQLIIQPIPKIETLKGRVNSKPGEVIYLWGNNEGRDRYVRVAGFTQACSFDKIILNFQNPLYTSTEINQARVNLFRADKAFHLDCLHGYEMIKLSSNRIESVENMLEKICFGDLVALHGQYKYANVCGFVVNYNSERVILSHQDIFCGATGDSRSYHFDGPTGLKNVSYKLSAFPNIEILKTRKDFDEELKKKEESKKEESKKEEDKK